MSFSEFEALGDQKFFFEGDFNEALKLYYLALESSPNTRNTTIRNSIVDCLNFQNKWEEALSFLQQTTQLQKHAENSCLYRKIRIYLNLGKVDECNKLLNQMSFDQNAGSSIEFYSRKALVASHLGQKEEALKLNKKASELVNLLANFKEEWKMFLLVDKGNYLLELGKYQKALKVWNEPLASTLKSLWNISLLGKFEALYYLDNYKEALLLIPSFDSSSFLYPCVLVLKVLFQLTLALKSSGNQIHIIAKIKSNSRTNFNVKSHNSNNSNSETNYNNLKNDVLQALEEAFKLQKERRLSFSYHKIFLLYCGRVYQLLQDYQQAFLHYEKVIQMQRNFRNVIKWKQECEKFL